MWLKLRKNAEESFSEFEESAQSLTEALENAVSVNYPDLMPEQRAQKVAELGPKVFTAAQNAIDLIYSVAIPKIESFMKENFGLEGYGSTFYDVQQVTDPVTGEVTEKVTGDWMKGVQDRFSADARAQMMPDEQLSNGKNAIADLETEIGKEITKPLLDSFAIVPDIKSKINKMLHYIIPSRDPKTGARITKEEPQASLNRILQYLYNILNAVGTEYETSAGDVYTVTFSKDDPDIAKIAQYLIPSFGSGIVTRDKDNKIAEDITISFGSAWGLDTFMDKLPVEIRDKGIRSLKELKLPGYTGVTPRGVSTEEAAKSGYTGETPQFLDKPEFESVQPSFFGFDRIRNILTDVKAKVEKGEVAKNMDPAIKAKLEKALDEGVTLSPEDWEAIAQSVPEVKQQLQAQASLNIPLHPKKAVYDVVLGDEVVDAKYGTGAVTSVASLDDGVIEVTFGPNVRIAHYPVAKIASPCYVESEIVEFKCPMDLNVITAEACLGEDEFVSPCSFLKFIDDKPHCSYADEMKKMKTEDIKKEVTAALNTIKTAEQKSKITAYLQEQVKLAKFDDHKWYTVAKFTPIRLHASVVKKGTEHTGEVIERNADSSLVVAWDTGEKTVNWENELVSLEKKAQIHVFHWTEIDDDLLKRQLEMMMVDARPIAFLGEPPVKVTDEQLREHLMSKGVLAAPTPRTPAPEMV